MERQFQRMQGACMATECLQGDSGHVSHVAVVACAAESRGGANAGQCPGGGRFRGQRLGCRVHTARGAAAFRCASDPSSEGCLRVYQATMMSHPWHASMPLCDAQALMASKKPWMRMRCRAMRRRSRSTQATGDSFRRPSPTCSTDGGLHNCFGTILVLDSCGGAPLGKGVPTQCMAVCLLLSWSRCTDMSRAGLMRFSPAAEASVRPCMSS